MSGSGPGRGVSQGPGTQSWASPGRPHSSRCGPGPGGQGVETGHTQPLRAHLPLGNRGHGAGGVDSGGISCWREVTSAADAPAVGFPRPPVSLPGALGLVCSERTRLPSSSAGLSLRLGKPCARHLCHTSVTRPPSPISAGTAKLTGATWPDVRPRPGSRQCQREGWPPRAWGWGQGGRR